MRRKGVVLVVVIGVLIVVFTLALVALYLMTQDARIAEHKIRRIRGLFAARAGMVHALEQARNGRYDPPGPGACNAAALPTRCNQPCGCNASICREVICIGAGIAGYPANGLPVRIDFTRATGNPMNTHRVDITVDYD